MTEDTTEVQSREIGILKTKTEQLSHDLATVMALKDEFLADRAKGEKSSLHSEQIDTLLTEYEGTKADIEKLQSQYAADRIVRVDAADNKVEERFHPIRPECRADHRKMFEKEVHGLLDGNDTVQMRKNMRAAQGDMIEKTLNVGTLTEGGALVPEEYISDIIVRAGEVSPIRELVQTRQVSGRHFSFPRMITATTMTLVGELSTMSTTTEPTFELISGEVGKAYARVPLTREMLSDSAFNIKELVSQDVGEAYGNIIGDGFVSGTGAPGVSMGITISPAHSLIYSEAADPGMNGYTETGASGAVPTSADPFWDMRKRLGNRTTSDRGRNASRWADRAMLLLNYTTLADLMQIKTGVSSDNRTLWPDNAMLSGLPLTIAGLPYKVIPDMASPSGTNYIAAMGVWSEAYRLYARLSFETIVDPWTSIETDVTILWFFTRFVGLIRIPEAFNLLRCSS